MKKYFILITLLMVFSKCMSQITLVEKPQGMYFLKTQIENYETGNPVNVTYYLYFDKKSATLNFSNNKFAMCEGQYFFTEKKGKLYLKRDENDGRICVSLSDENKIFPNGTEVIFIKKKENKYFIKSKRLYDSRWQLLIKKTN
jgi:hypothetical protein